MSWLAGLPALLVTLLMAVTPVMTEPLSRDHLNVAPVGAAVGATALPAPAPGWWICTR